MNQERVKNPVKQMAIRLVHQMDEEKDVRNGRLLPPFKEEEVRECGRLLRNEIWKKGFDVTELLALGEEYKTLSWDTYYEWLYR